MGRVAVISANSCWNIVNFRMPLIEALRGRGFEVAVVAPFDKSRERLEGVAYFDIPMNRRGTKPVEELRTFSHYLKLYSRLKPEIAFHFTIKPNIYGGIAANLLGVPAVNTVTGLGKSFISPNWTTPLVKKLYRLSFSKSRKIFFQNHSDLEFFVREGIVERERCGVVPGSGIDPAHFPLTPLPPSAPFRFLLVGRIIWEKGVKEFVEAARLVKNRYPAVQFQLLGKLEKPERGGVPVEKIEEWEREGIVEYLGVTTDVRGYISQAHCLVLPSYREGVPRALLEGCSMGRPAVATAVPGCSEVIKDGVNGFLCPPRDSQKLAQSLLKIVETPLPRLEEMGRRGRELVIEKFSNRRVLIHYLSVLEGDFKN